MLLEDCKTYTKEEFEKYMAEMKEMSVPGFTYLNLIPTKHWARPAFSTKCKSGMMLNNCCESFNNVLRKCKDKPVLELLEWIRRYNMTRIWSKSERVAKLEGNSMPSVIKQLGIAEKEYRHCRTEQSGPHEYEVEYNLDRWIIDLEKRTCNCFKWDLTGIPCVHAYACIKKRRGDPKICVHEAYSKEVYVKAYSHFIKALPGPKQWEKTDHPQPEPPAYRKIPGKPSLKKKEKRSW
ncbi:uncharacterized protein LOC141648880 [Silene latifolia]|uniref:uncharacterized protein LOC141648880 n=1 Tax=Silene latifolia TaxID=37657 RepID=UPI003D783676